MDVFGFGEKIVGFGFSKIWMLLDLVRNLSDLVFKWYLWPKVYMTNLNQTYFYDLDVVGFGKENSGFGFQMIFI